MNIYIYIYYPTDPYYLYKWPAEYSILMYEYSILWVLSRVFSGSFRVFYLVPTKSTIFYLVAGHYRRRKGEGGVTQKIPIPK